MSSTVCHVRVLNYADSGDAASLLRMMQAYAGDPAGGGTELAPDVLQRLVPALAGVQGAFSVGAWIAQEPVGLINCLMGFSTFAARPLVNVHDVVVMPSARGQGVAARMMHVVEQVARERGACKITLEVLQGNRSAQALYRRLGFAGYALDPAMGTAEFLQKKLD